MKKPKLRRTRPATPEEIARRRALERELASRPEMWGPNFDAFKMRQNSDITANQHGKKVYARRVPWIDRAVPKETFPAENAAMVKVQDLITLRKGEADKGGIGERVDCSQNGRSLVTDRMIAAAERLDAIKAALSDHSGKLLFELLDPKLSIAPPQDQWRLTVARLTGETAAAAQAGVVRLVAGCLAETLDELDRSRTRHSPC